MIESKETRQWRVASYSREYHIVFSWFFFAGAVRLNHLSFIEQSHHRQLFGRNTTIFVVFKCFIELNFGNLSKITAKNNSVEICFFFLLWHLTFVLISFGQIVDLSLFNIVWLAKPSFVPPTISVVIRSSPRQPHIQLIKMFLTFYRLSLQIILSTVKTWPATKM